jgi:hypothetical protein
MKPKHCKDCLSFAAHKNKKNLTEAQKRHDNWCCAKGQPAIKSIAFCINHNLKRLK